MFNLSVMTHNEASGLIQATDEVIAYIRKKLEFYSSKARVPKIVLAERSCSGAVFRLFFEAVAEGDERVRLGDLDIYLQPGLVEDYGGFSLDLEVFFFARRLLISPLKQSFQCDCKSKCNKRAATAAIEDI